MIRCAKGESVEWIVLATIVAKLGTYLAIAQPKPEIPYLGLASSVSKKGISPGTAPRAGQAAPLTAFATIAIKWVTLRASVRKVVDLVPVGIPEASATIATTSAISLASAPMDLVVAEEVVVE